MSKCAINFTPIYMNKTQITHGGDLVGLTLKKHGVKFLFTLCGGHISPILLGCKKEDIRVIDTRHEVTTVYAADAVSRLTGIPGVAAVTAGPGLTNTITAVKNAQMAESAIIILGGATATILKGRGSLQDIDQVALMKPHVKWVKQVKKVKDIVPALEKAFLISQSGTPGPVFIELPIDLLYPQELAKNWYITDKKAKSLPRKLFDRYLEWHFNRIFKDAFVLKTPEIETIGLIDSKGTSNKTINEVQQLISKSKKPLLLIGSQAMIDPKLVEMLNEAVIKLNIPVYLSGMARGLLGKDNFLQLRHKRRMALKAADLVILAGAPMDFRLDYGRHFNGNSKLIFVNVDKKTLNQNKWIKRPTKKIRKKSAEFIISLSKITEFENKKWLKELRSRDTKRNKEIASYSTQITEYVNPIKLCQVMEKIIDNDSVLIGDGGDFISTISYIIQPRQPLRWLDPGVFGTLGPGAGFALASKLVNPYSETWLFYGDGSAGYSLSEFDTFVRHKIPIIAVIGNDASWQQIAREQVELFKDPLGTDLRHTEYHKVVNGFGGKGYLLDDETNIEEVLKNAKKDAAKGSPVLINALIGKTDFRKGSISM